MLNINNIIEFFGTLSNSTEMYVTNIEVKPIKARGDLYITGLKRCGLGKVEVHLKEMKEFTINSSITLNGTPTNDIWMPSDMLSDEILSLAYESVRKRFYSLKSYEVSSLSYRLKTESDSDYIMVEEVTVFEDKTQAYRDAIRKRKGCDKFKSKFFHFGEQAPKEVTDLEFAEAAL